MSDEAAPSQDRPLLRVVNPDATAEEVAALVAVLSTVGSGTGVAAPRRTPEWSANHRKVRTTHLTGPGGWRSSALPR